MYAPYAFKLSTHDARWNGVCAALQCATPEDVGVAPKFRLVPPQSSAFAGVSCSTSPTVLPRGLRDPAASTSPPPPARKGKKSAVFTSSTWVQDDDSDTGGAGDTPLPGAATPSHVPRLTPVVGLAPAVAAFEDGYASSLQLLRLLPQFHSPQGKARVLSAVLTDLSASCMRFYDAQGAALPSMNTDDLLPVVELVLLRVRVPSLPSQLHYIKEQLSESALQSELGFAVTLVHSAMESVTNRAKAKARGKPWKAAVPEAAAAAAAAAEPKPEAAAPATGSDGAEGDAGGGGGGGVPPRPRRRHSAELDATVLAALESMGFSSPADLPKADDGGRSQFRRRVRRTHRRRTSTLPDPTLPSVVSDDLSNNVH